MLRIGLTGGIGAGKSAVARRLAHHGAVVIDADQLARQVVAPGTEGLAEVVAAFGQGVLGPDGALDRAALAAVVFSDEAARRRLEDIIHPRVRAETARLTAAAPPGSVVVNDVPLLAEAGLAPTYHLVVVVEAAQSTRIQRLVHHRGMDPDQARARIAAQAGDDERRAVADVLLRNDGTLDELYAAVDRLWRRRLAPFADHLRQGRWAPRPVPAEFSTGHARWQAEFARLAARLRRVVGPAPVDHVGPTAVPGLAAEDVIDVQVGVPDMAAADALAGALTEAGFPPVADVHHDPPLPGHPQGPEKRLHAAADPGRAVDLHLRVAGSPGWRAALLVRDFLRAEPSAWSACPRSVDPSPHGRTAWSEELWRRAQRWAQETGWQPAPAGR